LSISSNQEEEDGQDMWHVWYTGGAYTEYLWGDLKEGDHVEDNIAPLSAVCVFPNVSTNFAEILSCAHGNFEEHNKVLDPSIITINYCIIINAH
jgi:hypothetical protein